MLWDLAIDKSYVPDRYNDTKIVLMPKDPYWIYAYWDINDEQQNIVQAFGHGHWALKINHISQCAMTNDAFYIDVDQPTGNWYVYVNRPDSRFTAEIGFMTSNGVFVSLAQSNAVYTPRDRASDNFNLYYMNIFDVHHKPQIQQAVKPQRSVGSEAYFGISSEIMFKRS